jgi:hypothetical protein
VHPASGPPAAIAVVVYDDDGYRLHVADLEHARLTPVGPEREAAHQPVWSPEGARLAYRVGDQLLVHTDGAPRDAALTDRVEREIARPCAFSPDSRRLAIALRGGVAIAAIGPGAGDLGPATQVASYPDRPVRDLRWTPDGAALVVLVGASAAAQLVWIPATGGVGRVVDAPDTSRVLGWRGGALLTVETTEGRERVVSRPAPGSAPSPVALAPYGGDELVVLDYAEAVDRVLLVPSGDPDDDTRVLLASPGGATVPWLAAYPRLSDLRLTAGGAWATFVDRASGGERPGGDVYVVQVGSEAPRLVLPASPARSFSAPVPRPSR